MRRMPFHARSITTEKVVAIGGGSVTSFFITKRTSKFGFVSACPQCHAIVDDRFLRLCWTNAGELDAWRGTAKLYDLAGGIRAEQPIAESGIKGAGAKVSAGYSGEASYRLVADIPSRFLVCVTYFDGVHFAKRSGRTIDLDLVSTTLMSWSELMMRRLLIVI